MFDKNYYIIKKRIQEIITNEKIKKIFLANNTQKFSSFIDETSSSIIDLTSNLAIANEKLTKAFNLAESAKNGLKNMNRKLDPLTSLEGKMKKIETSVSFAENTNKKNYLK